MRLIDADHLVGLVDDATILGDGFKQAFIAIVNGEPTIEERKKGKWTTEEVAELLFNMFGDECACNFNGIDEWLPESCKYAETTCPNPTEKHGCWMQFLLHGASNMDTTADRIA